MVDPFVIIAGRAGTATPRITKHANKIRRVCTTAVVLKMLIVPLLLKLL